MKKVFAGLLMISMLVPSLALAANTTAGAINASSPQAGLISTLSNKVTMYYYSGGNAYACASAHESGNKIFASTSADTKIYVKSADNPVTNLSSEISDSDTAQFSSNWGTAL